LRTESSEEHMKKRALISVYDKTGVADFCRALVDMGYTLISTGNTFRALDEEGIPVTQVSSVTGFPEIMDGRVKTLHLLIHGGILARPISSHMEQAEEYGIGLIDIVVGNLYPFRQTIARDDVTWQEAVEDIDIGGPAMIRAAAKNHERVAVIVDSASYAGVLDELRRDGAISREMRLRLAAKAFRHTADYDACIAGYFEAAVADQ